MIKIACANSAFLTAATWAKVCPISLLDSEVGNTVVTTAYVESAAFTPGAITIDGIAVKLYARTGVVGTMSVRLAQAGATVAGTEVTINTADLCSGAITTNEGGWVFFKFASPVLLVAATAYTLSAKTSDATQVTLWRNGTVANWSRMLRTTTADEAPVATDILHIMEEKTGAGAATARTVTMNQLAAAFVDLGSGTDGTVAITVSDGGTLDYEFSAATAYYLKCSGNLIVYNGGTFTIGTVANPIPRNSTAVLEFDPVADGGMGLIARNGSTFTAQGLSRTVAKNIVSCKLNTDEAAAQTVLGVNADTGWLAGDEIGIASTTRTYSQCEKRTLSVDASGTELTITAGLTNAHSGTSPTQAEVILLTRNVKIRGTVSTVVSYVNLKATATVDIDWAEFYWLGENLTNKRGIEIETTTGSCNIQYSSFHDFEDYGVYITGSTTNNITFSNNNCYNLASLFSYIVYIAATSGTSITFDNNILMLAVTDYGFYLLDIGGIFTNNTVVGINGQGFRLSEADVLGTFSGNVVHSCADVGITIASVIKNSVLSSNTVWRCDSYGIYFGAVCRNLTFNTLTLFGNTTANIYFLVSQGKITFNNLTSNGNTTFATISGISGAINVVLADIKLNNCDFSTVAGIKTAHTNDINVSANTYLTLLANNCKIPVITGMSGAIIGSYIKSQRHGQADDVHKTEFVYGKVATDAVIFRTATPSARLTPNNASNKLESGSFKVNVNSGQTCTPSIYGRESVAGDGTDYTGSRIRLILKRNDAIGIVSDTVIATATIASEGAFELLTGITAAAADNGVMEFVIDVDGTTGFCNLDDFSSVVT